MQVPIAKVIQDDSQTQLPSSGLDQNLGRRGAQLDHLKDLERLYESLEKRFTEAKSNNDESLFYIDSLNNIIKEDEDGFDKINQARKSLEAMHKNVVAENPERQNFSDAL